MKRFIVLMVLASVTFSANAQENAPKWTDNFKLSGYGILQYQGEDKEGNKHNEFNLRLMRLVLDGKIKDFDWRVQVQGTNNVGPGTPTVQLVDLYTEWVRHKEFRVRI